MDHWPQTEISRAVSTIHLSSFFFFVNTRD
jgi:hypothetical protein